MSPVLKANAHLNAVIDACHSGSILDLPFELDRNNTWKKENSSDVKLGFVNGSAFMISGCMDNQTSGDTRQGGILTCAL